MLQLVAVSFDEACKFILVHHRHHLPARGWKFGVGCELGGVLVGVVVVGRPVARMIDDGYTLEVTRMCTDGSRNACSFLYGAARRASRALGYRRLITYTLESESGVSLIASGFVLVDSEVGGGSWSRKSRGRVDKAPLVKKKRWEVVLC